MSGSRFNIISIHAPVKSATVNAYKNGKRFVDFNPRARKERDHEIDGYYTSFINFNPRARKERD